MPSTRTLTLVIASALFMESLDSTVIATSLAAIAVDLAVDPVTLKLAFTAYYLALAVFIPISGWLADRYGSRQVFRVAIAVFTVGSLACGIATSLGGLVAARGLQGIGGAMMSDMHCNFMINTGTASAHDLETLGEEVRRRVFETSGIELRWEVRRIGTPLQEGNKA